MANTVYGAQVVYVMDEPCSEVVSFSTVTVSTVTSPVTVPTVGLRGRREILIRNNSGLNTVWLSTSTTSTAAAPGTWELPPGGWIKLKWAYGRQSSVSPGTVVVNNLFATASTTAVLKVIEIK